VPGSLHAVCVQTDLSPFSNLAYFAYGLDSAYLITGMDNRDKDGFGGSSFPDIVRVSRAVLIYPQTGYREPSSSREPAHLHHCMVLEGGGDDVTSLVLVTISNTLQGETIRFRSPAGESNLPRIGANKLCHLGSGLFGTARASCPQEYTLEGSPEVSVRQGSMASSTSGCVGVAAA